MHETTPVRLKRNASEAQLLIEQHDEETEEADRGAQEERERRHGEGITA